METIAILIKKLLAKYIKGKAIKHFIKDVCFLIVAVLIMLGNSLGRWEEGQIRVKVQVREGYNYVRGLNFETMGRGIQSDMVSVERIRFGCAVDRKVGINARFGYQTVGYWNGSSNWHNGIDQNIVSEKLYSAISGKVVSTSWDYLGGGNLLVIEGIDGWRMWYAHMGKIEPVVGQEVMIGDYVGVSGNTGSASTGHHLHTSFLHYGKFVDPMIYLPRSCFN